MAMREGELAKAERLAEECFAVGAAAGDADAAGWYGAQLLSIRWLQGRSAELLDLVRDLDQAPTVVEANDAFAAATASVAAAAGDLDLARQRSSACAPGAGDRRLAELLAGHARRGCRGRPGGRRRRHRGRGPRVARPVRRPPVMASLAVACLGSVHHPLGVTAVTVGDLDAAVDPLRGRDRRRVRLGNRPATRSPPPSWPVRSAGGAAR